MISKNKYEKRPTYWDTLFKNLKKYVKNIDLNKFKKVVENKIDEILILDPNMDNICFVGHFISYKYFEKHFKKIYDLIGFDEMKQNIIDSYKNIDFINGISIHIRTGDHIYKNYLLDNSYYIEGIATLNNHKKINDKSIIYIFGEKPDIQYLNQVIDLFKKTYPTYNFELIDVDIPDYIHLLMMSIMKCNIISNSTFSYWSAMLNTNIEKEIICPLISSFMKSDKTKHDNIMKKRFPENWNKKTAHIC